jgi:predicted DCC family thiol-disulfide oxidoreductase YuxK
LPASRTSSSGSAEPRAGGAARDGAWLLYDADCGLCRFVVARVLELDRGRRLRPLALQDPRAAELLPGLTAEQRMASFHLVERDGTVHSAGAGLAAMLGHLPAGRRLERVARRFPGATSRLYSLVADNRTTLGRLVPAGAGRQARRRIAERDRRGGG